MRRRLRPVILRLELIAASQAILREAGASGSLCCTQTCASTRLRDAEGWKCTLAHCQNGEPCRTGFTACLQASVQAWQSEWADRYVSRRVANPDRSGDGRSIVQRMGRVHDQAIRVPHSSSSRTLKQDDGTISPTG